MPDRLKPGEREWRVNLPAELVAAADDARGESSRRDWTEQTFRRTLALPPVAERAEQAAEQAAHDDPAAPAVDVGADDPGAVAGGGAGVAPPAAPRSPGTDDTQPTEAQPPVSDARGTSPSPTGSTAARGAPGPSSAVDNNEPMRTLTEGTEAGADPDEGTVSPGPCPHPAEARKPLAWGHECAVERGGCGTRIP